MIATLIVTVCLCLCLLGTDSAGSNPLRTDNWLVGNGDSDRTFSGNGWNSGGIGSRTNNRREVSRERFLDSVFSLFYGETYVHEAVSSERNGDSDCRSFSYSCSADSPDSNGRLVASEEKFGDGTTEIEEDSEIESEQDIANPSAHSEKLRMGGSGGDDGDGEGNADNSDSQRPLKVLKGSSQELYSNVDVNDLSPRDRSIHELKLLWRGFVQPSPSEESVQQLMAVGVDGARKDIFLPAMGNTNRTALYQQLLHQFLQPVSMTGRKTQWLDQEFSLMIKGIAAIAQYPELTEKIAGVPKVTRGIHVGGPAKSTGLQAFMHTMITALAHSLQTNIVYLNARTMESVRQQAQDLGISAKLLTKHGLLSALFEFIQDDGKPYMVILNDNLSWLLNNHAVSKLFLDELNSAVSRAFFVLTDPDDGLRIGQTLPSLAIKESGSTSEADSSQGQSPNPTFFGGYPPFNPFNGNSASGSNPQSSNSNNLPKSQGVPQEFPFPPPPNGMHRPMVTGRSFQVVIQNGTATMTPLPPGTVPPGFPGSNPEAFMKRIMEHQKMMQQRQKDGQMAPGQFGFSFPNSGFPADMTEEDFHEFMQDPENQAKLKVLL